MCGTRDAAMNWQAECSQTFIDHGFEQGKATPCVFHHVDEGMRALVHGDDYFSAGDSDGLAWLEGGLKHKYDIKGLNDPACCRSSLWYFESGYTRIYVR